MDSVSEFFLRKSKFKQYNGTRAYLTSIHSIHKLCPLQVCHFLDILNLTNNIVEMLANLYYNRWSDRFIN